MYRETNTSQLNSELFELKDQEVMFDEEVSDETWVIYLDYLYIIYDSVTKLRKDFYYTNDQAMKVNGEKKRDKEQRKRLKREKQLKLQQELEKKANANRQSLGGSD